MKDVLIVLSCPSVMGSLHSDNGFEGKDLNFWTSVPNYMIENAIKFKVASYCCTLDPKRDLYRCWLNAYLKFT